MYNIQQPYLRYLTGDMMNTLMSNVIYRIND